MQYIIVLVFARGRMLRSHFVADKYFNTYYKLSGLNSESFVIDEVSVIYRTQYGLLLTKKVAFGVVVHQVWHLLHMAEDGEGVFSKIFFLLVSSGNGLQFLKESVRRINKIRKPEITLKTVFKRRWWTECSLNIIDISSNRETLGKNKTSQINDG